MAADGDGFNAMGLRVTGQGGGRTDYTPAWGVEATQTSDAELARQAGVEPTPRLQVNDAPLNALGLRVTNVKNGIRRGAAPAQPPAPVPSPYVFEGDEGMFGGGRVNLHAEKMASTGIQKGHVNAARAAAFGNSQESVQEMGSGVKLYTTKILDPISFEFAAENGGTRNKVLTLDLSASQNLRIKEPATATRLTVTMEAPAGMARQIIAVAEPASYGNVTLAASLLVDEDARGLQRRTSAMAATPGAQQGETVKTKRIGETATLYTYTSQRPPGFRWEIENHTQGIIEFSFDLSKSEGISLKRPTQEDMKIVVRVDPRQTLEVGAAGVTGGRAAIRTAMSVRQILSTTRVLPPSRPNNLDRLDRMTATFNYTPEHYDEAELREGDEVYVQTENGDGWAMVLNVRSGKNGLAPLNYLRPYGSRPDGRLRSLGAPTTTTRVVRTGVTNPNHNRTAENWTSDQGSSNEVEYQGRRCMLLGEVDGTCQLQTLDTRELLEAPVAEVHQLRPNTVRVTQEISTTRTEVLPGKVEAQITTTVDPEERRIIPGIRVDARTGQVRGASSPGKHHGASEMLRAGIQHRGPEDLQAIPKAFRDGYRK